MNLMQVTWIPTLTPQGGLLGSLVCNSYCPLLCEKTVQYLGPNPHYWDIWPLELRSSVLFKHTVVGIPQTIFIREIWLMVTCPPLMTMKYMSASRQ